MGEEKKEYSRAFTLCCLLANIALSIGIVLVNKSVYEFYQFPNMTLTCLHFVCTSLGMLLCRALGLFQPKQLPLLKMAPIALTFCGFVVFTNLSLQYNTVGTYQIIKSMTTPCIIFLQSRFYDRLFSARVKLTLVRQLLLFSLGHSNIVCLALSFFRADPNHRRCFPQQLLRSEVQLHRDHVCVSRCPRYVHVPSCKSPFTFSSKLHLFMKFTAGHVE